MADVQSNVIYNVHGNSSMPLQKLPQSKKDEQWGRQSVEGVIAMAYHTRYYGRSSRYRKQVNYDLVNSIFDEQDFQYVLNPYGVQDTVGNAPSRLRDFNIIVNKLNTLKGEEIKRPFNFRVVAINGEAVNAREEKKKQALIEAFQQELAIKMGTAQPEQDPQGNPIPQKPLGDIAKYYDQSYVDIREQMGNQVLQYLMEKEKMLLKFNLGFEHANIVGEEIYYVGIKNGEPACRVVNPLNFYWDKNPDLYTIEDAQWAMEERFLPVSQIIDEYGEFLTEEDLDKLDSGELGGNRMNLGMQPGFVYNGQETQAYMRLDNYHYHTNVNTHISVINIVWKSMRLIGFLSYIDDTGDRQETIVDDSFKVPKGAKFDKNKRAYIWDGNILEWRWINEVWKGTKIGRNFYVDVAPLPNQCRPEDNPFECKLPYVGRVYNSLNSNTTSLVDLMKPHQYLYNIVWYRLEAELAKAKGKAVIMDLAMIPRSHGIDLNQWMYYLDNVGVQYINSAEQAVEGDPNSISKFNQFREVDRSLSNVVGQYMMILSKLEEMVGNICGINKQREGQASPTETATGVQANLIQSSNITEPIFYIHNEVKRQVLTQLLEASKIAYAKGKKTQFVLDDMYRVMLELDGEMFNESDYAVFVSNSQKDNEIFEKLQSLAQAALQNDKLDFSDIIKIFKSNSISEVSHIIEHSEQQRQQMAQQQQQSEMQNEQFINQQKIQWEKEQEDREDARNKDNNETKVKVAEISALSFDKNPDMNGDNIPDALEVEEFRQKAILENRKLDVEQQRIEADTHDKEKNRQHQMKLADKQAELKKLELNKKEKIEKYKVNKRPKPNK